MSALDFHESVVLWQVRQLGTATVLHPARSRSLFNIKILLKILIILHQTSWVCHARNLNKQDLKKYASKFTCQSLQDRDGPPLRNTTLLTDVGD